MLGELIYQAKGKITGTRVLNADENKVEHSAGGEGRFNDIDVNEIDTFWAIHVGNNVYQGEGQGIITTKDGRENVTFKGYGVGHISESGKISFRGTNFYKTVSNKKLSFLNNMVGVFEFEVDESGNFQIKVWEWK